MAQEQVFFKDLPLSFTVHPVTKDISMVKNEEAVKSALRNLLKTPQGTRPFRPDYGVNLLRYLFEPATYATEVSINKEIAEAIQRFEPRVQLIAIESKVKENAGIDVTIEYTVSGFQRPQVLETTITTRLRLNGDTNKSKSRWAQL